MSTISRPTRDSSPAAGQRRVRPAVAVVPDGLVVPTTVLVVAAVLLVALLGVAYGGTSGPSSLDADVEVWLRDRFRAGWLAYALDGLVTPVPALGVVGTLTGVCLLLRRVRLAVVAATGPLGSYVVTSALKPLVGRSIHGANLSFPSGHAAYATALGLVVGLLIAGRLHLGRSVSAVLVLAVGLALGVGMAVDQVVLDAHYPTDTLGGLATGVAVVGVLSLATDRLAGLRRTGDPKPSPAAA